MTNMVKEVHGAIMDDEDDVTAITDDEADEIAPDFLVASASANINRSGGRLKKFVLKKLKQLSFLKDNCPFYILVLKKGYFMEVFIKPLI